MNFNLLKTAFLLVIALIAIPIITYYLDAQFPFSALQYDTLVQLIILMLGLSLTCFVVGEITKNTSQVDKLWSIVPSIYVWIVAFQSGWNARLVLMAIVVTIWAARLTYNFSRRGGYSWKFWTGEEDYRWEVLRQNPIFQNKWVWKIFHLLFICLYQMSLILLFTLPIMVAWQGENVPLSILDYLLALIFVGLVAMEYIADQQQWDFQTEKYRRKNNNEDLGEYSKGFIDTGLWAKMRHPNYFAEQSIWVVFYFFSVSATGRYLNWSMAGAILLLLLFQGSADFSEKISSDKYPAYLDYIKRVPRFLPKFW